MKKIEVDRQCPVNIIKEELKSMRVQYRFEVNNDAGAVGFLVINDRTLGLFIGHLRELPGQIDSKGFFLNKGVSWEEIPLRIRRILKLHHVEIY